MVRRKWYVVTVGRDIGVFPTWLEAGPLVKGVPNAIHQSFLTRAEATRMFEDQQARGRTRIIDPDLDAIPAVTPPPQRARNYSAPSPFPSAPSTFGMTPRGHHRSPVSVHPTTTSSRNRTSNSTPSPISLSDRRGPIVSGTSNSTPAMLPSNPRSGLGISPSLRRFQMIQAALEQELRSGPVIPARSQGQVQTPFPSDINTSPSLTSVPGPSSSSRTRNLQRAATASPDIFQSHTPGPPPASTSKYRESASTFVGFDARAPPVNSGHSYSNTNTNTKLTTTGGARTSNSTTKTSSEPSSSSRGLHRTPPYTSDTFHSNSRLTTFDPLGCSSVSPRAIVKTPEWIPAYPTSRTPSPDSDSSAGTTSPGPSDELLSPLSNVNLNSFALDHPSHRGNTNTIERNTPSGSVNSITRHPTPRGLNTPSQSPTVFSNGTPHQCDSSEFGPIQLQGEPPRIEVTHDSDPRSPILGRSQIPELPYKSALEISFARPSPRINSRPLTSSPLSNFSVNGHGPSLLFRH